MGMGSYVVIGLGSKSNSQGYIDHHEIYFNSFLQCAFWFPSTSIHRVKIIQTALLKSPLVPTMAFFACLNHLNQFSIIFTSIGATQIFLHIQQFCIPSFLLWSYIHLNILISITPTFFLSLSL